MTETGNIRAVLFAKNLSRMVTFYSEALGLNRCASDDHHAVLNLGGFELIIHQIPGDIADAIEITHPPARRESSPFRLDYPVESIERSRASAKALGGEIDEAPAWASSQASFYLGYDPEGNVFGVSEPPIPT